jgi:DNA-directed RNA polymerase specialized sigma24 family protein
MQARQLNVLAERYYAAKGDDATASSMFVMLLRHLDKLIISLYYKMHLETIGIELDDFRQEVAMKLWRVVKHYDPERGVFASFAITVMRQVGSKMISNMTQRRELETPSLPAQATSADAGVHYDEVEVAHTLTKIVAAFTDFCERDQGCADVARSSVAIIVEGEPLPFDLAKTLGCSRVAAARRVRELLSMFGGYLAVYEGVVDRESWRKRFR